MAKHEDKTIEQLRREAEELIAIAEKKETELSANIGKQVLQLHYKGVVKDDKITEIINDILKGKPAKKRLIKQQSDFVSNVSKTDSDVGEVKASSANNYL